MSLPLPSPLCTGKWVAVSVTDMQRREARILAAFGIWTIYVWITRMWNILRDDEHDGAFKAVHSVLAIISIAFAIACLQIVRRVRTRANEARRANGDVVSSNH